MTKGRKRFTALPAAICTLFAFIPATALAGAWTQAKGRGQLIVTALHYSADERFNNAGNEVPQARYSKQEINPYIQYGLTDRITVGANLFLDHLDDSTDTTTGLGDSEFFARWQAYRDERYAIALQPEIKLPSPQAGSSSPAIGSERIDFGARVLGGMNFAAFGRNHFAEAEAGYRRRSGTPEDQILLNATLGMNVTEKLMIMPQLFGTLRASSPDVASFTQSPRDDYDLAKAQLSGVYRINERHAVQLGAFAHIEGTNTAKGGGALLAWWMEF